MNTKRHGPRLLLACISTLAVISAASGCGPQLRTPIGECYAAASSFALVQDGILVAVSLPELEGSEAKTLLKQVSQGGTDAVDICKVEATKENADGVSTALGTINGAIQIGGQMATKILADKAAADAARRAVARERINPASTQGFGATEKDAALLIRYSPPIEHGVMLQGAAFHSSTNDDDGGATADARWGDVPIRIAQTAPAVKATPAVPSTTGGAATPAVKATPAVPVAGGKEAAPGHVKKSDSGPPIAKTSSGKKPDKSGGGNVNTDYAVPPAP